MLRTRVLAASLAVFFGLTYLSCILFGLIVPPRWRMDELLTAMLPGFHWLTVGGFLIGLAEAMLLGAFTGLVWPPIYRWLRDH